MNGKYAIGYIENDGRTHVNGNKYNIGSSLLYLVGTVTYF